MPTFRRAMTVVLAAAACAGCAASVPMSGAPSLISVSPDRASPVSTVVSLTYSSTVAASAPPGAIAVQAGPGPIFRPSALTASSGDIQIFLTSPPVDPGVMGAKNGHNIGIRAPGKLDIIARSDYLKGGDGPIIFTVSGLEPGTYSFICEFPQHAAAGMYGTLTIEP